VTYKQPVGPGRNPLLQAALRDAELGYSVFPCKPGEKVPLTQHGCKDATTDPERIERWWTQWPDANIGLATDGLLVVDVDGADNRWPGDPDKALELAQAPISRTPRGGRHCIFRQPPGKAWRCTTGRLAAGVDTRADGGYIVVPPSVVNGKPYQFAPGLDLDVPPQQLPEPPAWLAAQLDALKQAPAVMADATAQRAIPKGQRNDTLFNLACKLRRDGLSAQAIEAALQAENRQRCLPPLSEDEVTRIAHSAGRYPPGEQPGKQQCPDTVSLADIEAQEVSWLWPGYVPLGHVTLVAGRPGVGKSFLCLDIAARVSTGRYWPGSIDRALEGMAIMITSEDDPASVIRPRMEAAGAKLHKIILLRGTIITNPEGKRHKVPFTLADVDILRQTLLQAQDCRLVIIDPVGSYLGQVDAFRDNEVRALLEPLAQLAGEFQVAVVIVTHTRKALAAFADDMPLGSRAFVGLARSVLHVCTAPDNPERRLLLPGKMNLAGRQPGLAFRIAGTPARLEWESDPVWDMRADDVVCGMGRQSDRGPEPEARARAAEWLADLLRPGPMAVAAIQAEAKAAGLAWRTVRRAQEGLGVVVRRRGFGSAGTWEWALPIGGHPPIDGQVSPIDGQVSENLATYGGQAGNLATYGADGLSGKPDLPAPDPGPDNQALRPLAAPDGSPPGGPEATPQGTPPPSLEAAVAWLRMSLEARPQPVEALLRWWTRRGYDPALLHQARERIGAVECQDARMTYWRLPN
jgi:hypothetical protein